MELAKQGTLWTKTATTGSGTGVAAEPLPPPFLPFRKARCRATDDVADPTAAGGGWKKMWCDVCVRELNGPHEWAVHLKSKGHRYHKRKRIKRAHVGDDGEKPPS